jgi:membrane-associated phospholipid phosphatase
LKRFLKDNLVFYALYLVLLTWAGYYLITSDKINIHRKIISLTGHSFSDTFYMYITHLGDGVFAAILALIVGYFNIRNGVYVLFSYIVSGLTSSLLKNYVFDDIDRPFQIWQWTLREDLPRIKGVEVLIHNSFPSGHATTAFAIFTCLALISKNKFLKVVFLLIAANAAFSRTYISQHWLVDIYFGSLLGLVTATGFYFVFYNPNLALVSKLNRPLFQNKK